MKFGLISVFSIPVGFFLNLFYSRYFEIGILLTIVTNCVFMALSNPPKEAE